MSVGGCFPVVTFKSTFELAIPNLLASRIGESSDASVAARKAVSKLDVLATAAIGGTMLLDPPHRCEALLWLDPWLA